ncbi:hypothetical protein [Phenylobacterium sp.]|uniref:hypothetical protein n=1 Tax=Phenylobacterium sp. TaxID=1871053 RepID=UPI003565EDDD
MARSNPKAEAAVWFATLSRLPISTAELWDFHAWRRRPANKAAYLEVERAELRRPSRFAPQPDPEGFRVIDKLTGEPATFANTRYAGISEEDADAICDVLNRRARQQAVEGRA